MANEQMRENWAVGAAGWVTHQRIFDTVLRPFGEAVIDRADLAAASRVLDVGCGTGALLEQAVASGAEVVGVDISEGMVEAASRRVPAATVVAADAQTADLLAVAPGDPFERVTSRFGMMFFDDPVAACSNVRRAAAPGARLAFVCWRGDENRMFTLGTSVLEAALDEKPPSPAPGAPGPLAFADGDRVRTILADSGWDAIAVEPDEAVCDFSLDGSDGVEERLALILGSGGGRAARAAIEPSRGADGWARVEADIRAELRRHLVDGAIRFPGYVWLVTARNPG